jgi:hypothetical protein
MSAQTSGKAAKPISSSAHFPRITKHDLEVVVEAMDKLREALRVDEATKTPLDRHHLEAMLRVGMESTDSHMRDFAAQTARDIGLTHEHTDACYGKVPETEGKGEYLRCGLVAGKVPAVPPSVDGLEGQCRFEIDMAMLGTPLKAPGVKEREAIAQKFASVIRNRDRELVEKLEGLLSKGQFVHGYYYYDGAGEQHEALFVTDPAKLDDAEKENEILRFEFRPLTKAEYDELRAVLAARKGEEK